MWPLFVRNLRHHALLLLAIAAAAVVFELLVIWVVAQMDMGAGLNTFLTAFIPEDMREIMFEQFGLASFPGAVAFGFQHPLVLVGAVAFVVAAASVPAGERESGFLDLLLARPVPRSSYLLATLLVVVAGALIIPLALLAGVAGGLALVETADEPAWTQYAGAAVALFCLLLAVGGYSLLISAAARRRGTAVARAVGLTLVFYWLDFMGGIWDALDSARWLSPFTYLDPARASIGAGLGWRDPLLLAGVGMACLATAFVTFRRQDL